MATVIFERIYRPDERRMLKGVLISMGYTEDEADRAVASVIPPETVKPEHEPTTLAAPVKP